MKGRKKHLTLNPSPQSGEGKNPGELRELREKIFTTDFTDGTDRRAA